jgi:hypothetical protein
MYMHFLPLDGERIKERVKKSFDYPPLYSFARRVGNEFPSLVSNSVCTFGDANPRGRITWEDEVKFWEFHVDNITK